MTQEHSHAEAVAASGKWQSSSFGDQPANPRIDEIYACDVFDERKMRERLPKHVFNNMKSNVVNRKRISMEDAEVIATSMSLAKTIGKIAVLCRVCHGFIGNRMLFMRGIEAEKMILEGATPARVSGS